MQFARPFSALLMPGLVAACVHQPIPREKVTDEGRERAAQAAAEIPTHLQAAGATKDPATKAVAVEQATELARTIDASDPYSGQNVIAVARSMAAQAVLDSNPRDYQAAVKRLDDALLAHPEDAALWEARGRMQYDRKYFSLALRDLDRALEQKPSDVELRRMIAWCHRQLREPKAERKAWEALIAVKPDDARAHYHLSQLLLASGDAADRTAGDAELAKAAELDRQDDLVLQALAQRKIEEKSYAEAYELLARAAAAAEARNDVSRAADVLFNQGAVAEMQSEPVKARMIYEHCLALDPKYRRAAGNLGAILLELGERDEAIRRLNEAYEQEKESSVKAKIAKLLEGAGAPVPDKKSAEDDDSGT